jgi:predicted kinase
MVLVGGLIGSGKSTLAAALGRARGWAVVSSDATRKHLAGLGPLDPGGPEIYAPDFSRRVYAELFCRAARVLESGRGVVLDATFLRRQGRAEARSLAVRFGVPFFLVETWSPEAVLRERLRGRAAGSSPSDAREDLLESMRAAYEPVLELPTGEYMRLDSTRPIDELVVQADRIVPGGS